MSCLDLFSHVALALLHAIRLFFSYEAHFLQGPRPRRLSRMALSQALHCHHNAVGEAVVRDQKQLSLLLPLHRGEYSPSSKCFLSLFSFISFLVLAKYLYLKILLSILNLQVDSYDNFWPSYWSTIPYTSRSFIFFLSFTPSSFPSSSFLFHLFLLSLGLRCGWKRVLFSSN